MPTQHQLGTNPSAQVGGGTVKRVYARWLGRLGPGRGRSLDEVSGSDALGPQGNRTCILYLASGIRDAGPQRKQIFSFSAFLVLLIKKCC